MDMTDSSLFSKFKKLNAEGAFRSLETSLRHSCKDGLADAISALRPEAGAMTWQHVAKACALTDESDSHQPHLIEDMARIRKLCGKRFKQEEEAITALHGESAFRLWQQVGHLQSNTLRPHIQRWLENSSSGIMINLDDNVQLFGKWWGLVQVVRSAQELSQAPPGGPSAADWEAVLFLMMQHNNVPQEECDIFGKCELCWRFVPLSLATGHNHLYCARHERNTLEYKRALEVKKIFHKTSNTLESAANRLYKATREHWIANHDNLPGNWITLLPDDVVALARCIEWTMEYHAGLLERYFPCVCKFVVDHGYTITPFAIVECLDPIPDDLSPESRKRWEALHHVFGSNLALFRREMCHAEIFLRLYDRLFSGVKRGGARPRKKS